jgi:hypothetical protein
MRWMLSCFVAAAALSVACPARADDEALRKVLSQRYAAIKMAMAARDTRALAPLLTADFRSEELDGQSVDRAGLMAQLSALPPKASAGESHTTLTSVIRHGDTADVQQRYSHITNKGQPPHAVALVTMSRDTWTRVHGTWRLARTRTDAIDYRVDGKTLVHKARDGTH